MFLIAFRLRDLPQELSTWPESFPHARHSNYHFPNLWTYQSRWSAIKNKLFIICSCYTVINTLHVFSSESSMFLAARSLWTNFFRSRYFIPDTISLQNRSRVKGVFDETISPGLKYIMYQVHACMMCGVNSINSGSMMHVLLLQQSVYKSGNYMY